MGANTPNVSLEDVSSVRNWLWGAVVIYLINFIIAWYFKESFGWTMARMLFSGVIAYISISQLISLGGDHFDNIFQIFGAEGALDPDFAKDFRYIMITWLYLLVMMIISIAVGFEEDAE
jgi:Na+/H+ antiporter NhaD/arsenite permease-like protein